MALIRLSESIMALTKTKPIRKHPSLGTVEPQVTADEFFVLVFHCGWLSGERLL
jgi:hypothetical protein